MRVVISSGHGKYIRGAEGPSPWGLDEVDEARKVVNRSADLMRSLGVNVTTFHDDVSDDQDENLKRIVDYHNAQGAHDLDISVHFNSADFSGSNQTNNPVGCEVFYESSTGEEWAEKFVDSMSKAGKFINRGAKDGNLYFLNHTAEVAVLLEVCFVNSKADADLYRKNFEAICGAVAGVVGGESELPGLPPPSTGGVLFEAVGKCSYFGGPDDTGVSPSEGLAFIFDVDEAPHLFLPSQPSGTTGLARRLNPYTHYIACRWDYDVTSKDMLKSGLVAWVTNPKTGFGMKAFPSDWGPHGDTNRIADLSPSLMEDLGLTTDDQVEVIFPYGEEE
jgi:N-acetylmuramoyl-L-alanine amidase